MVCGNCPHKIELGKNARKIQKASKEVTKVALFFEKWRVEVPRTKGGDQNRHFISTAVI